MTLAAVGATLPPASADGSSTDRSPAGDSEWGPVEKVVDKAGADSSGPLVVLPNGDAVMVWLDFRGPLRAVVRSADTGVWSKPVDVSQDSRAYDYTAFELPNSRVIVYWQTGDGIRSRTYKDGVWSPNRLQIPTTTHIVGLYAGHANGSRTVSWYEEGGLGLQVAVRHGKHDWETLPALPPTHGEIAAMTVDAQGRPSLVAMDDDQAIVLRTYDNAAGWTDVRIGPTPGHDVTGGRYAKATVATNHRGSMAIGWREVEAGSVGDVEGTSLVRVVPAGGSPTEAHSLTDRAKCGEYSNCLRLGITRADDVVAEHSSLRQGGIGYWLTRYDGTSGQWASPEELAPDIPSSYFSASLAVGPTGVAFVRISSDEGDISQVIVCKPAAPCGPPTSLDAPRWYESTYLAVGPHGSGVMVWGDDCMTEECYIKNFRARALPPS